MSKATNWAITTALNVKLFVTSDRAIYFGKKVLQYRSHDTTIKATIEATIEVTIEATIEACPVFTPLGTSDVYS